MLDELRLETFSNATLVVTFGSSITYEDRENPENSFYYFWNDLWPEQMEVIKQCSVWAETAGLTFKVLEGMIENYDENDIVCTVVTTKDGREWIPTYAMQDIDQMEHHYLNH